MVRPKRAVRRGWAVPLLVAAVIGFLAGSWNRSSVLYSTDVSAAQNVALRFPEASSDAAAAEPAITPVAGVTAPAAVRARATAFALFDPQPMVPQQRVASAPALHVASAEPAVHLASAEPADAAVRGLAAPAVAPQVVRPAIEVKAAKAAAPSRPRVSSAPRQEARPGYMLNDAQIASIKARLNLTPDQEGMWPAVEAALRNIAYTHARDARRSAGAKTEMAAIDPNSAEVQGLKSAAIPLIMSFSSEQKDEVRNLAHVMGLDQLAAQF